MKRVMCLCLGLMTVSWAWGDTGADASFFQKGRTRLSLGGGYGTFNDNDYGIVGVGAGYYVIDHLEANVEGDAWLGSTPHIYRVSPGLTYVLPALGQVLPYVGGFYRRTYYDHDLDPLNSAGGRAGVIFPLSSRSYLSAGLVYEGYIHCDESVYSSCSEVYPEAGIAFSF